MKTIGMIGLGAMGQSIAENILSKGYSMLLYDIRPENMMPLVKKGARMARSIQEVGIHTDTILVMVNTFRQCQSVMNALMETLRGGTVIQLGTMAIDEAQILGQLAAEHGCQLVDCPVSGGTRGAKAGTLTLMAACSDGVFQQHLPLLECFGSKVVHVGQTCGQGQAVKAINQLLVGIHMCATAEAFTLASRCGLDLETMSQVICASAGCSEIFKNRGNYLIERDFSTRSTLQIQLKDADVVCRTADQVGAPTPLTNTVRELFKLAVRKYPPTDDSLEVVRIYEELCGQ
jgi:3-hydroxyisobutyrate dehydrogenase